LILVLSVSLAVGLFLTARQLYDKQRGAGVYDGARELAGAVIPEDGVAESSGEEPSEDEELYYDPHAEALAELDLAALREVNADVVGWICIPDTAISYPILQAEDNSYYLNRTWEGEWNSVGSIFLDSQVSADFSDFNTLVYGHRMLDGSMFGSLQSYGEQSYWEEHPSIYVVSDDGVRRYDIFAAHEAVTDEITFGLHISSRPKKEEFVLFNLEQSAIETGVRPNTLDHILTLSTCTGRGYSTRWVVQGVLREGRPEWMEEKE